MTASSKPKPRKDPVNMAGMHPGADPTAPGGMSIAALRVELAEKHGVPMEETRDWGQRFPVYIDRVIAERRAREVEAKAEKAAGGVEWVPVPPERADDGGLADIEARADQIEAYPIVVHPSESVVDEADEDDFSDLDFDDYDTREDAGFEADHPDTKYNAAAMQEQIGYVVTTEPLGLPARIVKQHDDLTCRCGAPESEHYSVDPPHSFVRQGSDEDLVIDLPGEGAGEWHIPVDLDISVMFEDEEDAAFEDEVDAMLSTEKIKPPSIFIGMPGTYDYIFDGHYGASPSGAERWAHCTASLQASREFLETLTDNQRHAYAQSGTAARQGTTAHAAGEAELLLMLGRISQAEYDHALLDLTLNPPDEEAYDQDMAEHLTEYVDYVRQMHESGRPLLIEERVTAKVWLTGDHDGEVSERTGSVDCGALPHPDENHPEHNVITAADLKYGNGIDVTVQGNPQVRIYLLGLLARFIENGGDIDQIERAEYVIVQPRLGGIKVWEEPIDDLFAWRDEVLAPALTAALYGVEAGAVFAPSDSACQWCPARGGCVALIEERMAAGASMFDEVLDAEVSGNSIDPVLMSNDRLGEVLAQITALVDLKDAIKEEVQARLHRGQHVAHHELVNYTPARSWKPTAKARIEEWVKDGTLPKQMYKEPPLLTPTQALTLLKEQTELREMVEKQVDVHDVVPVVGPDEERRKARGDRRKSWNGRAPESMFADETDHTDTPAPTIEEMFPT